MLASKAENRPLWRFSIVDMIKGFYNQSMKKNLFALIFAVSVMFLPLSLLAADLVQTESFLRNSIVIRKDANYVYMKYPVPDPKQTEAQRQAMPKVIFTEDKLPIALFSPLTSDSIAINSKWNYSVYKTATLEIYSNPDNKWLEKELNAWGGFPYTSDPINNPGGSYSYHQLFNLLCPVDRALECWIGAVWTWSQGAILILAVLVVILAGIIYMTSAGSPKQVALAKKLILGALSGVAVIVLGKFFLTTIIGVPWL
jgi:hypothetical protein